MMTFFIYLITQVNVVLYMWSSGLIKSKRPEHWSVPDVYVIPIIPLIHKISSNSGYGFFRSFLLDLSWSIFSLVLPASSLSGSGTGSWPSSSL